MITRRSLITRAIQICAAKTFHVRSTSSNRQKVGKTSQMTAFLTQLITSRATPLAGGDGRAFLVFNDDANNTIYLGDNLGISATQSDVGPLAPGGSAVFDGQELLYGVTGQGLTATAYVFPGGLNFFQFVSLILKTLIIAASLGNGLFVYNGSPGVGDLFAWITAPGTTTDPYGNTLPNDFGGFGVQASGTISQLLAGALNFSTSASLVDADISFSTGASEQTLALTSGNTSSGDEPASIQLTSGASSFAPSFEILLNSLVVFTVVAGGNAQCTVPFTFTDGLTVDKALTATGGTEAAPTLITTDTWNSVPYVNAEWGDYTGNSNVPLRYRLTNDGMVEILGGFAYTSAGTALSGNNAFTTALPAGYQPSSVAQIPCMILGGTGTPTITANRVPYIQIATTGVISLENVSGAGTSGQTAVLAVAGRYRIT